MDTELLAARLREVVGAAGVIDDRLRLRTFECDGLTAHAATPALAVLPTETDHVVQIVRVCAEQNVPFVARGAGTGLSGGALPRADGVLIVMSRMRRVIEVDPQSRVAVVEPGVANLDVTRAAAPHGLYYAPDPSSQQVCSIGGNVAENSGGAHCLKYGFTVNHVLGLEFVTPDGQLAQLGGKAVDSPGLDLIGAVVGSEGTLGIVTKATVRLLHTPESVTTMLAGFSNIDDAGACVSDIVASGIVPAAVEMMDALAIEAAEAAVDCRYPTPAGAVLIVEVDGPETDVAEQFAQVRRLAERAGAFEIREASGAEERKAIWTGRKSAFAAVGRISPAFIVQDGVVPRTALGEVLRDIAALSQESGIRVANVFHAGDGNLHPLVLYDDAVAGEPERAEAVSAAILDLCLKHGGSITGEHGVGVDKSQYMPRMYSDDDLDTMKLLRGAFDPAGICNPGKVFPTPRLCGEAPSPRKGVHRLVASGEAELF